MGKSRKQLAYEIVAADCVNHDAPYPVIDLEGVKASVNGFKKAFPDAQVRIAFQLVIPSPEQTGS